MADASKDNAAKARVVSHMNGEHKRELTHYLRHYAKLSASAARNPTLDDITFTEMTISTPSSGTHKIPIQPALTSWSDARTRAVDMDTAARKALGVPDVQLSTFVPPTPGQALGLQIFYSYVILSGFLQATGNLAPGTYLGNMLSSFPGGAERFCSVQKILGGSIAVIHALEATLMAARCEKYGIARGSKVWWQWVSMNFLEGFGAHQRFGALLRKTTKEKESKKH